MADTASTSNVQQSPSSSPPIHICSIEVIWHNQHTYSSQPALRALAERQTWNRITSYATYLASRNITQVVIMGGHHVNQDPLGDHWTVSLRTADGLTWKNWHIYLPGVEHPFQGLPFHSTPPTTRASSWISAPPSV